MNKLNIHMQIIAGFICGAVLIAHANAQDSAAAAAAEMQKIEITGVRDPALMPYKEAYDTLTRLNKAGAGRVDLVIRVVSSVTKQPIPNLALTLRGDTTYENVPVTPDGVVMVPLNQQAYADNAEFITNQKKGSLGVHIHLVPKLAAQNITYAELLKTIDAARRARAELVPWYARLFVKDINGVSICYPDNTRILQVGNSRLGVRPANIRHYDNMRREQVYCADFGPNEAGLDQNGVIAAPEGWRMVFL
jgi:hypothetical protein